MPRVIVIGGGISGLSAAYYLNRAGVRATVIEKQSRLGGVIRTEKQHGCVLEGGPDSFLAAKPSALELIQEVGLGDQVIGSNDHLRVTYILKNGRLTPMPDGLMMMVPTKILPLVKTRLIGWGTKVRMGLEYFRRPSGAQPDRSVSGFLLDHYGQEAVDYLTEPLLAGVYGGDPKQMSANSVLGRFVELETKYGSLTRGVLAAPRPESGGSLFRTLKGGLGDLIDRLAPSADIVRGEAESLEKDGTGFRVRVNGAWMEAAQVVVAAPAYNAAELLKPMAEGLAGLLLEIPYNSSITMSLGYRRDGFDHPLKGFGFLVPKKERERLTACTWVNNKFNHRTPDDIVVLRCFLSGEAIGESDASLLAIALGQLRRIMGLRSEPFFHTISRWPSAMAQYTVGHEKRVAGIDALSQALPGLTLIGNGYRGIGLPDCVKMGKEAAARIAATCGYTRGLPQDALRCAPRWS